jgi:predicted KAP-like P-loop ATPase
VQEDEQRAEAMSKLTIRQILSWRWLRKLNGSDANAISTSATKPIGAEHVDTPNSQDASDAAQTSEAVSSDVPIRFPTQDAYGIGSFAKMLARSIANADASDGLVFAVNGSWGSGKSSACNLIIHHLDTDIKAGRIVLVTFNPWWFSGAEALTISFFQELSASIGQSLSDQAKEALLSLGARVTTTGPLLGSLATIFASPALGSAVSASAGLIGKFIDTGRTVDQEHQRVAEALRNQQKKFVVIVDDIDRLDTEDALQIFRLVKSVGRLPNVIYVLAFDRLLAERMVSEHFPSEGPSYLEKFIQGGFDLPLPDSHDLRDAVLRVVESVMGAPAEQKTTRFWNLFHDVCAPLIRLPRDAVRLSNAIRVSWPVIRDDVDRADFVALEALRLFLPRVHTAIRANPDMLCGEEEGSRDRNALADEYEQTFLGDLEGRQREIGRRAILRLFPRVEAIWANVFHRSADDWRRDRLVCSKPHFPTYFAFSVPDEAITASEVSEALQAAGNAHDVVTLFRRLITEHRRRGGTRAALVLEELTVRASEVSEEDVSELLNGLFTIADEINVEADERRAFGVGNNQLRIHWLINNLIRDRFEQPRRSEFIENACATASLGFLCDIARRCHGDYKPNEGEQREQREPLVVREVADRLLDLCRQQLQQGAENGTLKRHRDLITLLFEWADFASDDEVRRWTDAWLADDGFVVLLTERVIQTSWSQGLGFGGLGDVVARRNDYVHFEPMQAIIDIPRFRVRVNDLLDRDDLTDEDKAQLERFNATPERDPRRA